MKNNFKYKKGAAMVEFALILPLFLVLVFGVIEFSLMLYDKAMITNASREAARSGIALRNPPLTDKSSPKTFTAYVQDVATQYCGTRMITFGSSASCTTTLYSSYVSPSNNTPLITTGASGSPLFVRVDYTYTYLVFGPLINLVAHGNWGSSTLLRSMAVMNFE